MKKISALNLAASHEDRLKAHQNLLAHALENNVGARDWTRWKADEAAALVDLANRASRMRLLELRLEGDLEAFFHVLMPVPRLPVNGKLQIGDRAILQLRYEECWRWDPPPGWAVLGLLHPGDAFMPNQSPLLRSICLGDLPIGIPPREIVLLGFYAITLQNIMLDETDPHGVLNVKACDYFRDHPEYLPLTTDGFLDPVS